MIKKSMNLIADALVDLGTERALILNSRDGMDEASIYTETDVIEIIGSKKPTIQLILKNIILLAQI